MVKNTKDTPQRLPGHGYQPTGSVRGKPPRGNAIPAPTELPPKETGQVVVDTIKHRMTIEELRKRLDYYNPKAKVEFLTGVGSNWEVASIYSENEVSEDMLVCIDLEEPE